MKQRSSLDHIFDKVQEVSLIMGRESPKHVAKSTYLPLSKANRGPKNFWRVVPLNPTSGVKELVLPLGWKPPQ